MQPLNVLVLGTLAVSLSVAMISMVGNLLWSRRVLAVMGLAGFVLALALFGYTFDPVRGVIGIVDQP